jgi:hypothetical protein
MDSDEMIRRARELAEELERLADETLQAAAKVEELRRKARQARQSLDYIEVSLSEETS